MKTYEKSVSTVGKVVIATILLITQLYPLFYLITSSFKTIEDFRVLKPYALPSTFNLSNYVKVIFESNIFTYFKNSIIILVIVLICVIFLSSTAAFAIAKINFKGRRVMMTYFLLGLMIPLQVSLIPLFNIYSKIGLSNAYFGVILPQVAFALPFSISLFISFYKFLPNDVIESAVIDGATPTQIFLKIITPMAKNIIVTVATMQGVFCWNEFMFTYTFTRSNNMQTVVLGLRDYIGMYGLTDWGLTFTAITVTVLPTFIIYFLLSKSMVSGLSAGAVKG